MSKRPTSSGSASAASSDAAGFEAAASEQHLQTEDEISSCPDITPEMIKAGVFEVQLWHPDYDSQEDLVCAVYSAMLRKKMPTSEHS
jgi:hypothetical protein